MKRLFTIILLSISLASPALASGSLRQGTYMGPADPSGVSKFAAMTGTHPSIASDYLPGGNGWSGMDGLHGSLSWLFNAWKGSGYILSLAVPILPNDSSGHVLGDLANGGFGAYNSYFRILAHNLIWSGNANAYLRLGWEFDGSWYNWKADTHLAEIEYAAYFRQIVTTMRSVKGEHFTFVWNPDAYQFLSKSYNVRFAYPGNRYVDVVGVDLYDTNYGPPETSSHNWQYSVQPALDNAYRFARTQNKPFALCEWGVVAAAAHGFGDDPSFITSMASWLSGKDVSFESYFNGNTRAGKVDFNLANFPQSRSAFRSSFGV